uniref:Uncharacterized protein n=1 Tax=Timema genevievae TaxID=629358 RepID=A0A7R9K6P5_TIMGE|nr:unnamed protein product [Timema genevievae]
MGSVDPRATPMSIDMASMLEGMEAQLQSSQVSSTVLDSPVSMYQGWGYHHPVAESHSHGVDMYHHNSPGASGTTAWGHHRSQTHAWMAAEAQRKQNWLNSGNISSGNLNSWGSDYGPFGGSGFSGEREIKVDPDSTTNHGSSLNHTSNFSINANPPESPLSRSGAALYNNYSMNSPAATGIAQLSGQISPISSSIHNHTSTPSSPFVFQQPSSPWANHQVPIQSAQQHGSSSLFSDTNSNANSATHKEVSSGSWQQASVQISHSSDDQVIPSSPSPSIGNSKQSPVSNISLSGDHAETVQPDLSSITADRSSYLHLPPSPFSSPQSQQPVISPQQTALACNNTLPSPSPTNTENTQPTLNSTLTQQSSPNTPNPSHSQNTADTAETQCHEINPQSSKTPERSLSVPLPLTPTDLSISSCSNSSRGGWVTPDRPQSSWDYNPLTPAPTQPSSPTQASPFRIPKGRPPSRSSNLHSSTAISNSSPVPLHDMANNSTISPTTQQSLPYSSTTSTYCKGFLKPYPPGENSTSNFMGNKLSKKQLVQHAITHHHMAIKVWVGWVNSTHNMQVQLHNILGNSTIAGTHIAGIYMDLLLFSQLHLKLQDQNQSER